jgi:hypothetical protein
MYVWVLTDEQRMERGVLRKAADKRPPVVTPAMALLTRSSISRVSESLSPYIGFCFRWYERKDSRMTTGKNDKVSSWNEKQGTYWRT